jgi:hypothetical protein
MFMNEAEVEIVAEELAKLGGTAWYPGRESGPLLRIVHERYRDRARAAIAALDRFRASAARAVPPEHPSVEQPPQTEGVPSHSDAQIQIGTTIIYRPEGDRRAYPCVVEKISNGFVYLVPENRTGIGWVPLKDLAGGQGQNERRREVSEDQDRAPQPGKYA